MFNFNQYRPTFNQLGSVFLILVAFLSSDTFADSASHRQNAEKLLQQINVPAQLAAMATQTVTALKIRLSRIKTTQEKAELVRQHIDRLETVIHDAYSWERNKESYIAMYTSAYSEAEMEALIEFFSSPAGRKFISPGPQFKEAMAAWNTSIATKLKPEMTRIQDDLKKALADAAPAPDAPP